MPLLRPAVAPRIWIGNRVKVQTHFDLLDNIACVVGGRRRFTLFPPEQVPNLYIGPLDFTPSGTPMSMVPLTNPDFARYPRFAEALPPRSRRELEPGDALYIPYGWWHHVEVVDAVQRAGELLVERRAPGRLAVSVSLLHALLPCATCPPISARYGVRCSNSWCSGRGTKPGPPAARQRGLLGPPSPERAKGHPRHPGAQPSPANMRDIPVFRSVKIRMSPFHCRRRGWARSTDQDEGRIHEAVSCFSGAALIALLVGCGGGGRSPARRRATASRRIATAGERAGAQDRSRRAIRRREFSRGRRHRAAVAPPAPTARCCSSTSAASRPKTP